jgi:two-component system phosphate regulon response regulator OmpR
MASNGRILIVEDDPSIRAMLGEYLRTHGYEVAEADRGTAMREAVEANLPDVVLLDVNLPGEDGLTLARFLRERYDVGIIMVTGAADIADRVAGLEVGADDYVVKPFDLRELLARVKSVLRRMQAPAGAAPATPAAASAPASPRVRLGICTLDLASHQLFGPTVGGVPSRWSSTC